MRLVSAAYYFFFNFIEVSNEIVLVASETDKSHSSKRQRLAYPQDWASSPESLNSSEKPRSKKSAERNTRHLSQAKNSIDNPDRCAPMLLGNKLIITAYNRVLEKAVADPRNRQQDHWPDPVRVGAQIRANKIS